MRLNTRGGTALIPPFPSTSEVAEAIEVAARLRPTPPAQGAEPIRFAAEDAHDVPRVSSDSDPSIH